MMKQFYLSIVFYSKFCFCSFIAVASSSNTCEIDSDFEYVNYSDTDPSNDIKPIINHNTNTDTNVKKNTISLGKKWYGASSNRDSTVILQKRAIGAVGKGTINLANTSISFAGHNDINTTRDALTRVRNLGSVVPAKCRFKNMNTGAF
jgi:hypothetical protein